MSRATREDQKYASIASRHIDGPHLDKATHHYARSLHDAMASGRMSSAQVNALSDDDHDRAFAKIAASNPSIARKPDPEPEKPRPTSYVAPHDYIVETKGNKP
jgi:hypothetical protein